MLSIKAALFAGLTGLVLGVGCDKSQSTPAGTPSATPSQVSPSAVSPTVVDAATAMTELAATYNAVSEFSDGSPLRRRQALILKADGTAELDTTVIDPGKPTAPPKSSDQATGTCTAGAKEAVVTFTIKNGKPIPANDSKHVMKLTRNKVDKSLMDDDGRTFERAK